MASSTITSKGQTTLPKSIRDRFGLEAGDRVEFVVENQRIVLVPATKTLADLRGILPKPPRAVTLDQMESAIRARRALRSR